MRYSGAMLKVSHLNRSILLILCIFIILSSCHKEYCETTKDDEAIISCLLSLPRRDLLSNPENKSFLEHHGIYLSVTTTPKRLYRLPQIFKTLDLTHVKKVFLVLPKDRAYPELPKELLQIPKLAILAPEHDLGPGTKLKIGRAHV